MEVPLTPLDFLTRARRLFPDRVGVIDGGESWTYAEFATRCDQHARFLSDQIGIADGDVVAWLCGNTHQLLEAYFGTLLAGGVLLPLNIRLSPAELRSILVEAGVVILFRHPDQVDPGGEVPQVIVDDRFDEALRAQGAAPLDPPVVDERAAAEIFFTSGSTGMPKGAVLTHRALYLHAVHNALTNAITGDDVILHLVPLFHVNGWGTPHYLTGLGGTHVMLPRFDAGEVLRLIEANRHYLAEQERQAFRPPAATRLPDLEAEQGFYDTDRQTKNLDAGIDLAPERRGLGYVFSHWTWLPSLRDQWQRAGERFTSSHGQVVCRLLTPMKMPYATAYGYAHPFDRPVKALCETDQARRMVLDTAALSIQSLKHGHAAMIISNNRAWGNAPSLARQVARRILEEFEKTEYEPETGSLF